MPTTLEEGGQEGEGHHDGAHLPIFAELHGVTCLVIVATLSHLAAPCSDGEACEFSVMNLKARSSLATQA